ncbi:Gliding motility-associated ABC transporter ATP-binding protein GldA [hydrothermal vent metagenome]|uniref:Gliding motility-associated ABC transporter ATP-binding protein GldA n=1 Tax=hydrothermal vent metagenome TaxID=652676 RepID=A0A3B0X3S3_9ZZZZ
MSPLISANNLTRRYGHFCAVNNISFELATGDILGFLGPNGAGKSSTMQMLTGNLAPTFGEITINGVDLLEDPKAAKASLGYLPENPPLYKEMTVTEYLFFCARIHRVVKQQINNVCQSAIEACGLGDVRNRLIKNLSKGYQQRVGIAQAILHSPPVIILDEPTVGLDPIQILEIRQLIKALGENHGIILCTHILPEVQAVCNRVQIINNGELVYSAGLDEMLSQESSHFEISFTSEVSSETLSSHSVFTTIKEVENKHFIVESDLTADKLIEYIVQQQWGLSQFTQQQTSLEQIFIELTLADANTANTSTSEQGEVA